MASYYAAIDATNATGAVYTVARSEAEALAEACLRPGLDAGDVRVVPCSLDAFAHVELHGGAPSRKLAVGPSGVRTRAEVEAADRDADADDRMERLLKDRDRAGE